MAQSFQDVALQLRNLVKNLPAHKMIVLVSLVGGTLVGFIWLMLWTGNPDYQLLYSNLSPEDAGSIVAKLKDQKIPYRISANGNAILIPEEKLYETRLELASQGLPQGGGVGFEIFDNTKIGMTEFVQNVNYQRALQGELSRTISGFSEVENSRVHIVMPSKSLFIEDQEPASASVVLSFRPGRYLNRDQVYGIVHLVSSSVAGLSPENVTIVDQFGKMLAGPKDGSARGQVSSDQLAFQEKVERGLEERIRTMLETALGENKAIVRVSCSLDFKQHERTEERYDPENTVIRSEQLVSANSASGETIPAGIPGFASNIPTSETATIQGGGPGFSKEDRTVNYEIGKVTSHIIEPMGRLSMISVAVLVDGSYKRVQGTEKAEEWTYSPRTEEEMAKYENIVKGAINFDSSRGDTVQVVNIPFEKGKLAGDSQEIGDGKEGPSFFSYQKYLKPFMQYGFIAVLMFLSFIYVVRPLVQWLTASSLGNVEVLQHLPKTVKEIEREYGGKAQALPFRDQALALLTTGNHSPEEMMQDWLTGD